MEIFDIVKQLCEEQNIKISVLERDLEFSRGSIYKMIDSSPSSDKLKKISDYFDVSADYLLGRVKKRNEYYGVNGLDANISFEKLLKMYAQGKNKLTPEEKIKLAQIILTDRNE